MHELSFRKHGLSPLSSQFGTHLGGSPPISRSFSFFRRARAIQMRPDWIRFQLPPYAIFKDLTTGEHAMIEVKKPKMPWRRRKVMLDTNVIFSYAKSPRGVISKTVNKALTEDNLQITSENYNECLRVAKEHVSKAKKKGKQPDVTVEEMRDTIDGIVTNTDSGCVKKIKVPGRKVLKKLYNIPDEKDRRILYAADRTGTEILVTGDNGFFRDDVKKMKRTMFLRPKAYAEENRATYFLLRLRWRLRK